MCNTTTPAPDEHTTGSHHGLPPGSRRPRPPHYQRTPHVAAQGPADEGPTPTQLAGTPTGRLTLTA